MTDIKAYLVELSGKTPRFSRLVAICSDVFGPPRIRGSHHIFSMPWAGNPRVNLQKSGKDAKKYPVKQVVEALERLLEAEDD